MGQKYLLNCVHCSEKLEIEPKNAGNQIPCAGCGNSTQAPAMREIKLLEPAIPDDQAAGSKTTKRNSTTTPIAATNRWIFLVGLITLISCSIATGVIISKMSKLRTDIPPDLFSKEAEGRFADMSPLELSEAWEFFRSYDMSSWQEHPALVNRRTAGSYRLAAIICAAVALVGLLSMVGAIVLGKRPTKE